MIVVISITVVAGGLAPRFTSVTRSEGTPAGRVALWHAGLDALPEVWLVGTGPDQQGRVLPRNLPDDFERRFDDVVFTDRAHNAILDGILAVGLLGTVPLLVAWFVVARSSPGDVRT